MIYTIGYQQLKLQDFISRLKQHGIKKVVDVRINPFSRVLCYSKKELSSFLAQNNIDYIHVPEMGTPRWMLDKYRVSKDYKGFFEEYKKYFIPKLNNGLYSKTTEIFKDNETSPVCLLCYEKNPAECHRSIIAKELSTKFQWEFIHL